MTVTLIADDLTGACDASALFAGRGRVGVFVDADAVSPGWEVAALDTDSRALAPDAARRRMRDVVRRIEARLHAGHVFKKIDSTLRGPVAEEIDSLLDEVGGGTALICPAFPGQGRTVTDGVLRVDGLPVHASSIGRDPAYRGATSAVGVLLGGSRRTVRHLPLDRVRQGSSAVAAVLAGAADEIVAADAETDTDLDMLAAAAAPMSHVILAGSAGLAGPVATHLGHAAAAPPLPRGRAWLVVAGSLHPSTRAQVGALAAAGLAGAALDRTGGADTRWLADELRAGRPVFLTTTESVAPGEDTRPRVAAALAAAAASLVSECAPDLVVLTGGETAHAFMRARGARRLEVRGAPAVGLALGELVTDGAPALACLTKAGGFGARDLLVRLLGGVPS